MMIKKLIANLEALKEPDALVFFEVFNYLYPQPVLQCCNIGDEWQLRYNKFWKYLGTEAWNDAALSLKPAGWVCNTRSGYSSFQAYAEIYDPDRFTVETYQDASAKCPAIAILICVLKTRENKE